MSDWRPMETAPRDGTPILASGDRGVDIYVWETYFGGCWTYRDGPTAGEPDGWMPLPPVQQIPTTSRLSPLPTQPTSPNVWGGGGFEVGHSHDGPGAKPKYCVHVNGVGSVPIAWFYRKPDADLWAATMNGHFGETAK